MGCKEIRGQHLELGYFNSPRDVGLLFDQEVIKDQEIFQEAIMMFFNHFQEIIAGEENSLVGRFT